MLQKQQRHKSHNNDRKQLNSAAVAKLTLDCVKLGSKWVWCITRESCASRLWRFPALHMWALCRNARGNRQSSVSGTVDHVSACLDLFHFYFMLPIPRHIFRKRKSWYPSWFLSRVRFWQLLWHRWFKLRYTFNRTSQRLLRVLMFSDLCAFGLWRLSTAEGSLVRLSL